MMRLDIFKQVAARIPRREIEKLFGRIMKEESDRRAQGKVNLIFTTDHHIRRLNKDFRNKNKPTDVLSFNFEKRSELNAVFGEIYVSAETAKRQAHEDATTLNEEILRLVCHGLLHLLGYDHVKLNDRTKMAGRENYFLNSSIAK